MVNMKAALISSPDNHVIGTQIVYVTRKKVRELRDSVIEYKGTTITQMETTETH